MSEIKKVKHILIIEDHTLMRLALLEIIKDKLTEALAQGAGTLEAALSLIDAQRFDIIFIDPGLPGINPTNIGERKEIIKKI
ncbi:MAG: response regulator, partial [Alphaproteobacteria bacterium]|nr:response regulator [Alphaproteobacteria bacterium]